MNGFTDHVEAEVNGTTGLTLGIETLDVEALEERIAPWLFGVIGVGAVVGVGGCGCDCSCST